MALTPVLFLTQSLAGGAILAGLVGPAVALLVVLTAIQLAVWHHGDRRFDAVGASLNSATGLGPGPRLRLFERSHTARDWVMEEMAFRVARKHAGRLRLIGGVLIGPLPALVLAFGTTPAIVVASVLHVLGALVCRWLFFAEAEHAVSLYYGR
jgi:DMSO reductase anchor subunit